MNVGNMHCAENIFVHTFILLHACLDVVGNGEFLIHALNEICNTYFPFNIMSDGKHVHFYTSIELYCNIISVASHVVLEL